MVNKKTIENKANLFHLLFFHPDKKVFYVILGVLILVAVFAAFVSGYETGKRQVAISNGEKGDGAPVSDQATTAIPFEMSEIFSLGGRVQTIEPGVLTFETQLATDLSPQIRRAIITKDTTIIKFEILKQGEEITGKQTDIKIGNIKAGDTIVVAAKENIKDKKEFTATAVQLLVPSKINE